MTVQALYERLEALSKADRESMEVFVAREQAEQPTGYGWNRPVTEIVKRNGNAVTFVLGYSDPTPMPMRKRQLP